jgi:NAD(P)-dependent dehydrogenase (short-subunit alcohol dehydrogenase family)
VDGKREVSVAIEAETLATWQRMIDLNLTSCFLGAKLIGAAMLARGKGGRIINIASISALISASSAARPMNGVAGCGRVVWAAIVRSGGNTAGKLHEGRLLLQRNLQMLGQAFGDLARGALLVGLDLADANRRAADQPRQRVRVRSSALRRRLSHAPNEETSPIAASQAAHPQHMEP